MVIGKTPCHNCSTMDCGKMLLWLRDLGATMKLFRSYSCLANYAEGQSAAVGSSHQAARAARKDGR